MKSILQKDKECLVCHQTYNLHCHHVFYGTSNRKNSEKHGLKVWLCPRHHNMSDCGVHFNKQLDLKLKRMAQKKFEETNTREDFMRIFGRNYLD